MFSLLTKALPWISGAAMAAMAGSEIYTASKTPEPVSPDQLTGVTKDVLVFAIAMIALVAVVFLILKSRRAPTPEGGEG